MSHAVLERSLPHNIDAERALLGAMLVNNEHIYAVSERLKPADFYIESHRVAFGTMLEMAERGVGVDLITLQAALTQQMQLEASGGIAYLASLTEGVPFVAHIQHYVELVEEAAISRRLIHAANKIMAEAFDQALPARAILQQAEAEIYAIGESRTAGALQSTAELQIPTLQYVEKIFTEKRSLTGLATGFRDIDSMTSGLQNGELIILAARPSVGKSAMASNIAQHVASQGGAVALFSLEMTKLSLMLRMAASYGRVDAHKMRNAYIGKDDFVKLVGAVEYLGQKQIHIDDASFLTVMDIRSKCRRLKAEKGLSLVIVDYLQLLSGAATKRNENRTQEVSGISRALKGLAKDLDVPVLALSQLSRAPEQRKGSNRPQLSDLRESGSIEQDADVVIMLFREELYSPSEDNYGLCEVNIAKQRNGPTGMVKLAFLREFVRFETLLDMG